MGYFATGDLKVFDDFSASGPFDGPTLCRPANFAALAIFKNFQRQLNRLLYDKKLPLIAEDGDFGPSTVNAVARAGQGTYNCAQLAAKAETFAITWQNMATMVGAPADPLKAPKNTPVPVAKPSSTTPPFPGAPTPGSDQGLQALLSNPMALGAMAVGGFLIVNNKKAKGGAKAKRKRSKVSRRRSSGRKRRR